LKKLICDNDEEDEEQAELLLLFSSIQLHLIGPPCLVNNSISVLFTTFEASAF
jgi:hypothetical protein